MSELICYEALKLIEKRLSQYELIKKAVADCRADHNYNGVILLTASFAVGSEIKALPLPPDLPL